MAANLVSRNLRVFIGPDAQIWHTASGAFLPSWNSLDEGGLIVVTATLEILPIPAAPESINPLDNPGRWSPGTSVRVEVRNDAGTFVQHPQGHLFILEEPEFPEPGGFITLQLGCRLAWHNSFEFDDDATGVVIGTPTNAADVAEAMLIRNEIPDSAIALTSPWPYALTVPEGKGSGGSFISQAGALAYCNDWRYLYVDVAGDVVNGALDLTIGSPVITITLGQNDVLYRAVQVEDSPPNLVRVAGQGTVATEGEKPIVEVIEVEGDRSQFEVGNISCPGSGVISRTTNITDWTIPAAPAAIQYISTSRLEAPRSAVAVDPNGSTSMTSPCGLLTWKTEETVTRYNQDPLLPYGRLINKITTTRQRRFTFTTNVQPGLDFATVKIVTETPTYAADGETIAEIKVEEEQAKGILDKTSEDPLTVLDVRTDFTRWRQVGNNRWQKTEFTKYPKALRNSSPESSSFAVATSANTSTTSTGANQPPKAEFWDAGAITNDQEFSGEAPYTLPGGNNGRTRKKLETLEFAFSDEQCQRVALKHIGLIAGRHRGALVEFPLSTALLTAPPLFPFDVVMPDGEIRHYLCDGLAFEHEAEGAKVLGVGVLVGTTAAPTEEVPTPAPVPLTAVPVVDDEDFVVDDSNQIYAVV
jgi:hypothetical protein